MFGKDNFVFSKETCSISFEDEFEAFEPYLFRDPADNKRKFYSSSKVKENLALEVSQHLKIDKDIEITRGNGRCDYSVFKYWKKCNKYGDCFHRKSHK